MKQSEWIAIAGMGVSALVTFGVWMLFPNLPWWVYPIILLCGAGMLTTQWTRYAADRTLTDRPDKSE